MNTISQVQNYNKKVPNCSTRIQDMGRFGNIDIKKNRERCLEHANQLC